MPRFVPYPARSRLQAAAYGHRDNIFHIIFRALAETRPFAGERGDLVWATLLNERERTAIELLAACLMPDHLHVVLRPSDRDIVRWVNSFKSYSTLVYRGDRARSAVWQPSFYDRLVRSEDEYVGVVRYIAANPISAGLKDWPWVWVRDTELLADFGE
jgi:putative transposase